MTTIKASSDILPRENKATAFDMSGTEIEQACRVGFANRSPIPTFEYTTLIDGSRGKIIRKYKDGRVEEEESKRQT